MEIKATIFTDAEAWLRENLDDFTSDGFSVVRRATRYTEEWEAVFVDLEEDTEMPIPFSTHVEALEQLVNLINDKKLFVGGIKNPVDLTDAGNWDSEVVDAYYQLLYHGEVIYG